MAKLLALILLVAVHSDGTDSECIRLLKSAYEQHLSSSQSGRMIFDIKSSRAENKEFERLEGTVEWDEDYFHFDGEYEYELPSRNGVAHAKHNVKILNSGGIEVTRLAALPTETLSSADTISYEIAPGKVDLPDGVRPDPVMYLTAGEFLSPSTCPINVLQDQPVTLYSVGIGRSVTELTDTTAVLKILYPGPEETWLTFDLTKGGLCSHYKSFWPRDGGVYLSGTRTWSQNSVGAWYPSESQAAYRRGSESAKPHFTGELLIHSFEPLSKRAFTGRATLTSFGPVPKGAFVSESLGEGRFREWIEGETGKNDAESELKRLADRIKSNSFMDDGKGSTK